jgi:energy-coupling factor transporter ATP-binding protein EcfA2
LNAEEAAGIAGDQPAIRVEGLRYRYPDGRRALETLDLRIQAGESVALVGPNGAGKSTLLWNLAGLLPERGGARREGKIWIDGIELSGKTAHAVRRSLGLLFQDPDDQLFAPTVLEDVAFGPLNLGMPRTEALAHARAALERVGLELLADRAPHHLSFGERKRVCLAGLLAYGPPILVLDEPSANLDPRSRRQFLALVREVAETLIVATHDLDLAVELCPRSVVMDGGRIVADGPTRDVLSNRALMERHGLEVPLLLKC